MRVAIAHDAFTQRGGAERVVWTWLKTLDVHSLTTLTAADGALDEAPCPVTYSRLHRFRIFRRAMKVFLPVLPLVARNTRIPAGADAALVSTSGIAHYFRSPVPRVLYWHTPARWLYAPADYTLGSPSAVRLALKLLTPYLLRLDQRSFDRSAVHLCNSRAVQQRLHDAYAVDATVVAPPVRQLSSDPVKPSTPIPSKFFVTVSRPKGYKNVSLVAEAAEAAGVGLVAVGGLPNRRRPWPPTIVGLKSISDGELRWVYRHAQALISASREDFGLTPLEANLEGTPCLVLRAGGFLDSCRPGLNGDFFEEESVDSVRAALANFRPSAYQRDSVVAHAATYSPERHAHKLHEALRIAALRH